MSRVIGPPSLPRVRWTMSRSGCSRICRASMTRSSPGSGRVHRGRLYALQVELDLDAFADEHAAGLERLVPPQTEVLAIDRGLGGERDALVAPRVRASSPVLDLERHLARDVPDR